MNTNISARDRNLLIAVIGLVIFLAAYFLGYQNLAEKNDKLEKTLREKTSYLQDLKNHYANLDTYEKNIKQAKKNIADNLDRLPVGIKDEDFLLYVMKANDSVGSKLKNISFDEDSIVTEFDCFVEEKPVKIVAHRVGTVSAAEMSYAQVKKYLKYVYEKTDDITFVDSVSLSFNAESAKLNTIFALSKYYIEYEGGEYEPVPAASVPTGTHDLF